MQRLKGGCLLFCCPSSYGMVVARGEQGRVRKKEIFQL